MVMVVMIMMLFKSILLFGDIFFPCQVIPFCYDLFIIPLIFGIFCRYMMDRYEFKLERVLSIRKRKFCTYGSLA